MKHTGHTSFQTDTNTAEMKKEIQKFESALSKGPSFDSAFLIIT